MRISDWSSDVCSSDLLQPALGIIVLLLALRQSHHRAQLGRDADPPASLRVAIVNAEIFPSTGFGADDCFMSQHRSSLSVIAMPSPASAAPGSPLNIVDRQFAVMSRSYCRPRQSTEIGRAHV